MDWRRRLGHLTRPGVLALVALAALGLLAAGWYVGTGPSPDAPEDPGAALLGSEENATREGLYADSDGDGLSNLLENYVYGSDPDEMFSRGGVVPDGWLARHGHDPGKPGVEERWAPYPGRGEAPEAFGDEGLPPEHRMTLKEVYLWNKPEDWDENASGPWDNGLDASVWDQGAGLPFTWLINHDLDPFDPTVGNQTLSPAPDGDGLTVLESYRSATDPRASDTDGDGLTDDRELEETGTDPARFSTAGHGVADGWAVAHGLDPTDPGMPLRDPDNDGLSNAEEFNASVEVIGLEGVLEGGGFDPHRLSSGGTGLPDGWVARERLDPFEPGLPDRVLQNATDYGPARDRGVAEVQLTVEDAYRWGRPSGWDEATDGPWMGGLSAATNDTDRDGLPDAVEIAGWTVNTTLGTGTSSAFREEVVTSDPKVPDTDHDGLSDGAEFLGRITVGEDTLHFTPLHPARRDTDFDGLSDHLETVEISTLASQAGAEGQGLDPTVQDTDADGIEDGREYGYWSSRSARYRGGATTYEFDNADSDPIQILGGMPGASTSGVATRASVAQALRPWGDLDDDGLINVNDDDADGDELLDGWEIDPTTYAQSPFSSDHERPATDPANQDTDGDQLPDGWETRHGAWSDALAGWNLDPSTWDSFGDGTPDGQRDLDDDGITWYTYERGASGLERQEHTFSATNLLEYEHGTDPNLASTPGNQLLDGWTIFWGKVYPEKDTSELGEVYPGAPGPMIIPGQAPRPSPSDPNLPITHRLDLLRFDTSNTPLEGEVLDRVFNGVQDAATGSTKDVYRMRQSVTYTFLSEQRAGTNPYLQDTDGDGAPDAWEAALSERNGGADPVIYEKGTDADGDGLDLFEEYLAGTDPAATDTDLGGVPDGEETKPGIVADPTNPEDDIRLRDASADTDQDGIPDVREVQGWEHPSLGLIRTDPRSPDTDGDGLADGRNIQVDAADEERLAPLRSAGLVEQTRDGGDTVVFLGEVDWGGDPRAISTAGDGTPDGWRAHWTIAPDDARPTLADAYAHARPSWWEEASMGPWWWGYSPHPGADLDDDGIEDATVVGQTLVPKDRDLDGDGLDDLNGEDPTPAARPESLPPHGFPHHADQDQQVRQAAATFGVVLDQRSLAGARDTDGDGVTDARDRAPVSLDDLQIHAPRDDDGTLLLEAGEPYRVTGEVTAASTGDGRLPVDNATLVVHVWTPGHPVGFGVTDVDGRFDASFSLQQAHDDPRLPPNGAFQGDTTAPVAWEADLEDLELGDGTPDRPNAVRFQVLNTSGAAQPGDPTYQQIPAQLETRDGDRVDTTAEGIRGTVTDAHPFTLISTSTLTLQTPELVDVGDPLPVNLTLRDATGRGIAQASVTVEVGQAQRTITTDDRGRAHAVFETVTGDPSTLSVEAGYDGSTFVQPSTSTADVRVRFPTQISIATVTPVPAHPGASLRIEGELEAGAVDRGREVVVNVGTINRTLTTEEDGRFQTSVLLPGNTTVGTLALLATYPGDDQRAAASTDHEIPVTDTPHIGIVPVSSVLRPSTESRLAISVSDSAGRAVPGPIQVRGLPGDPSPRNATVPADGTTEVVWTTPTEAGASRVEVTRPTADGYQTATNQTWLTVTTPTRILTDPHPIHRGRTATLHGTLEALDGSPITGGRITLDLAGETVASTVTGDEGNFTLGWTVDRSLPLGPAPYSIRFSPTQGDPWDPAAATGQLPVRSSVLAESESPHVLREAPRLEVTLEQDTGQPLEAGRGRLVVPALDLLMETPLESSQATYDLPLDPDAPLGTYDAELEVLEAPNIETPPVPLSITVASTVELDVDLPARASRGATVPIHVQAVDDLGDPVATGVATLRLPGGPPANGTLEEEGVTVDLPIPPGTPTGPATVEVAWSGPPWLVDTSTTREIDVVEASTLTIELPTHTEPGQRVEGSLRLTGGNGTPLAGETVRVRDLGSNTTLFLTTNRTGHAPLLLQGPSLGTAQLEVTYPGDERHGTATGTHTIQPVTPDPGRVLSTALTTTGLLILVAAGVAVAWVVRRRRLQEAVARTLDEGARRIAAGNEHAAAVVMTYQRLVEILSERDLVPEQTQTLREYQAEIQRELELDSPALTTLFDVFDEVLYDRGPSEPDQRDRARRAFVSVSRQLRRKIHGNTDPRTPEVEHHA